MDRTNHANWNEEMESYEKELQSFFTRKEVLSHIFRNVVIECSECSCEEIIACMGVSQLKAQSIVLREPSRCVLETFPSAMYLDKDTIYFGVTIDLKFPQSEDYMKIFLNVEARKKYQSLYLSKNRGCFYGMEELDSPIKEKFTISGYGKAKKIYNIAVCFNTLSEQNNVIRIVTYPKNNFCKEDNFNFPEEDAVDVEIELTNVGTDKILQTIITEELEHIPQKNISCIAQTLYFDKY